MRLIKVILIALLAYLLAIGLAQAQEQIAIPLSRPGEPGQLEVQMVRGSINIQSYEGKEVVVRINERGRKVKEESSKNGMRKISGPSFGLEASENDNRVRVDTQTPHQLTDLEILLPAQFSVNAKTVNDGNIIVKGLQGEMEVSNVNGNVELEDIRGSVVASTVNGDVRVSFREVSPDTPMAFSSLNGDIDVSFPANTPMTAQMKTLNGEIFTDFDISVNAQRKVDKRKENGVYKVSIDKSISGEINGGGPRLLFKNHNGNIYIRKH
ncbi:DUF4097 family beta strand repeat-containing protein [Porifericola rhodea]|uniref:DUF4097 family beta strand repeat-containing protein n=1 Tax=Porifericola rhodea TaxID=930972 RepID=UPI00266607FE|nr:DUF4097 family beta strand repeat-containing protein [Porifericola rhodea]WKN33843.1 DUF4097 family beta strand repeat-containing protein [Porifericola rhodea]